MSPVCHGCGNQGGKKGCCPPYTILIVQNTLGVKCVVAPLTQKIILRGQWPGEYQGVSIFPNIFLLLHCVPLYVCRLCINFQELCARLLGMATLRIRFSPSFHALLIDFLSIRKVIIFSAIATDDRHPLRSRSIHQNAANCMTIRFRYIAQSRGVWKTYCARSRNDVRRLTIRSNGMPSKKTMESLEDDHSCRNCSKARPECFKVATKFRSLYFIMLNKEIRSA